jgi:hypothetical protein
VAATLNWRRNMEQLNIYHELGLNDDPVYSVLLTLEVDNVVVLSGLKIIKNQLGLFEVFNDEIHECYSDLDKCYQEINKIIENRII